MAGGGRNAVHLIEGIHEGGHAFIQAGPEGGEDHIVQGAVVDLNGVVIPSRFGKPVCGKVFGTGRQGLCIR